MLQCDPGSSGVACFLPVNDVDVIRDLVRLPLRLQVEVHSTTGRVGGRPGNATITADSVGADSALTTQET